MIQFRSELYKLLPEKARVAELGVAEGNFSADILKWPNVAHLYMVDNWAHIPGIKGDGNFPQEWHNKNLEMAWARVKEFGYKVSLLKGFSVEMAGRVKDDSLDMVYLDADHSYHGVMSDLIHWFPKLKKGGVMAGHDYINPAYGVKQAVEDFTCGTYIVNVIPELADENAGFYFVKS